MKKVETKQNRNKSFLASGKLLPLFFTLIFMLSACGQVDSETLSTINNTEIITINSDDIPLTEQIFLSSTISESGVAETSDILLSDEESSNVFNIEEIPQYSGVLYVVVNDNIPFFTDEELTDIGFEEYSELDELGRCGVAFTSVGIEIMPTEPSESISSVYPTGWEQAQYDFVSGVYLYNRSHLLGFQLTGENSNELNLITGTRSFNVEGMLPFENMIADYE